MLTSFLEYFGDGLISFNNAHEEKMKMNTIGKTNNFIFILKPSLNQSLL